jgi:hypothetical protein
MFHCLNQPTLPDLNLIFALTNPILLSVVSPPRRGDISPATKNNLCSLSSSVSNYLFITYSPSLIPSICFYLYFRTIYYTINYVKRRIEYCHCRGICCKLINCGHQIYCCRYHRKLCYVIRRNSLFSRYRKYGITFIRRLQK